MEITAHQLSELLNGTLEGDPNVTVNRPSKIEEGEAGSISFLANPKYEHYAYQTKASILLVNRNFQAAQPIAATLIRVDNVYGSIATLLAHFGASERPPAEVSPQASVHAKAQLSEEVHVGAFTVIEADSEIGAGCIIHPQVYVGKKVKLGKRVTLYPGVRIYDHCEIGDQCIIHSNTVIGSDGFGFAPQKDGSYKKIAQIGKVIIEADVEIGANTVIDRATMGATYIRRGAKLDNLIQIAHNVEIGAHTAIAAQAGIAGSTKIGERCMIGGQAGFVGHIEVADGTKVQAQSGVAATVKEMNTAIYGSPALSYRQYLKAYALFRQLPDLEERLRKLEE